MFCPGFTRIPRVKKIVVFCFLFLYGAGRQKPREARLVFITAPARDDYSPCLSSCPLDAHDALDVFLRELFRLFFVVFFFPCFGFILWVWYDPPPPSYTCVYFKSGLTSAYRVLRRKSHEHILVPHRPVFCVFCFFLLFLYNYLLV